MSRNRRQSLVSTFRWHELVWMDIPGSTMNSIAKISIPKRQIWRKGLPILALSVTLVGCGRTSPSPAVVASSPSATPSATSRTDATLTLTGPSTAGPGATVTIHLSYTTVGGTDAIFTWDPASVTYVRQQTVAGKTSLVAAEPDRLQIRWSVSPPSGEILITLQLPQAFAGDLKAQALEPGSGGMAQSNILIIHSP